MSRTAGLYADGDAVVRAGEPFSVTFRFKAAGELRSLTGESYRLVFKTQRSATPIASADATIGEIIDSVIDAEAAIVFDGTQTTAIHAALRSTAGELVLMDLTGGTFAVRSWPVEVDEGVAVTAGSPVPESVVTIDRDTQTIVAIDQRGPRGVDAANQLYAAGLPGLSGPSVLALAAYLAGYADKVDTLYAGEGQVFNPARAPYNAKRWRVGATMATALTFAAFNTAAFQACADDYKAAVLAGDNVAVFEWPGGDYPVTAVETPGANVIENYGTYPFTRVNEDGSTDTGVCGYSWHAVAFAGNTFRTPDGVGGYLPLDPTTFPDGGIMRDRGCRLWRPDQEEAANKTPRGPNNSTLFLAAWLNMIIESMPKFLGYQVDSQAIGTRGITSGDSWQASFGFDGLFVGRSEARQGTNHFVLGLNKRHVTSTLENPVPGYDKSLDMVVRNVELRSILSINGEHGGLLVNCSNVSIGQMEVRSAPYKFRGLSQQPYIQRGIYCQSPDQVWINHFKVVGVAHVGLHVANRPSTRTANNGTISVGFVDITYIGLQDPSIPPPTDLDGNPIGYQDEAADRFAAVEVHDSNDSPLTMRELDLWIGRLKVRGMKSAMLFYQSPNYFKPDAYAYKRVQVDWIDSVTNLHGIYSRARAGIREGFHLGGGTITVLKDLVASTTVVPSDGLVMQAGADYDCALADANPITYAQLQGFTYWDRIAAKPADYIGFGSIKRVTDFPVPGGGGATMNTRVVYDTSKATGNNAVPGPLFGFAAYRPFTETPTRTPVIKLGQTIVRSSARPVVLSGADVLSVSGLHAAYVEEGVATGDDRRPLKIDRCQRYPILEYTTSDDTYALTDFNLNRPPFPEWRRFKRTVTRDLVSIPAQSFGAGYASYAMIGVKAGDIITAAASDAAAGAILDVPTAPADDMIKFRAGNLSVSALDPPSATFAFTSAAAAA